ncbi:MAG: histidine kinase [Clostridia bacterium]|nr:histidine kinase [Clostridia bacterium]
MELPLAFKVALQSVSVLLSLSMITYFLLKGKKNLLIHSYIFCQGLIFLWSLGQILEILSSQTSSKLIFVSLEYFSICFIGLGWLIFSLLYTNHKKILQNKLWVSLIVLLPALNYIGVITNKYHQFLFSEFNLENRVHGPLFGIIFVTVYVYSIIGTVILLANSIKQFGYAKKQSILLVIAALIPLLSNMNYVFRIIQIGLDITPISFSISMLLFAIAAFRYRFLNIVPFALRKIVDNMKESIVVIDNYNKIIDLNDAFMINFKEAAPIDFNDDISVFINNLRTTVEITRESEKVLNALENGTLVPISGELTLAESPKKCYSINIQPIFSHKNEILGRVASFSDVSEYKGLMMELDEKNIELLAINGELTFVNEQLMTANEQLKDYAKTAEELAITKERNRFARDVHDTLGHTMTLLISLLEVSSITCKTDSVKTEEKLQEATQVARDGLKELRRSISGLAPEKLEANNLITAIQKMVQEFRSSGVHIEFSVEGIHSYHNAAYSDVLYRVCQEALTNSLRHGRAKNITIILKFTKEYVKLFIFDDGTGCKSINKGFGLKGMEERIKNLDGTITYGSDGESGFNIHMEIPIRGEK